MIEQPLHHDNAVAGGGMDHWLLPDPGVIDLRIEAEERHAAAVRSIAFELLEGERRAEVTEFMIDAAGGEEFEDILAIARVVVVALMTHDDFLPLGS